MTARGGRPGEGRRGSDADRGQELPDHAALGRDDDRSPRARGARRLAGARSDPPLLAARSSSRGRARAARGDRAAGAPRRRRGRRVRARLAASGARGRARGRLRARRLARRRAAVVTRDRRPRADDVGGAERGAARGDGARSARVRHRRGHRADGRALPGHRRPARPLRAAAGDRRADLGGGARPAPASAPRSSAAAPWSSSRSPTS